MNIHLFTFIVVLSISVFIYKRRRKTKIYPDSTMDYHETFDTVSTASEKHTPEKQEESDYPYVGASSSHALSYPPKKKKKRINPKVTKDHREKDRSAIENPCTSHDTITMRNLEKHETKMVSMGDFSEKMGDCMVLPEEDVLDFENPSYDHTPEKQEESDYPCVGASSSHALSYPPKKKKKRINPKVTKDHRIRLVKSRDDDRSASENPCTSHNTITTRNLEKNETKMVSMGDFYEKMGDSMVLPEEDVLGFENPSYDCSDC